MTLTAFYDLIGRTCAKLPLNRLQKIPVIILINGTHTVLVTHLGTIFYNYAFYSPKGLATHETRQTMSNLFTSPLWFMESQHMKWSFIIIRRESLMPLLRQQLGRYALHSFEELGEMSCIFSVCAFVRAADHISCVCMRAYYASTFQEC